MRSEIGGWTLLKLLGQGGMGQVWKGFKRTDAGETLLAVIKLPLAMNLADQGSMRRWLGEVRAMMVLQGCGNVVRIYDAGVDRGIFYIVMEYVHGTDLGKLIRAMRRRREPMKIATAVWIAGEVLQALHTGHTIVVNRVRREIIHRDVAPKNVLIAADGHIKLADFGIALGASEKTKRNMGTERYMAPEHYHGRPTAKSDVFAWGLVLWEMLEGKRYFSDDAEAFGTEMMASRPKPLTRADVPPELAKITYDALARDEAQRPTSSQLLERVELLACHRQHRSQTSELVNRYFAEARTSGQTEAMLPSELVVTPELAGLFASAGVLMDQGNAPDPRRADTLVSAPTPPSPCDDADAAGRLASAETNPTPSAPSLLVAAPAPPRPSPVRSTTRRFREPAADAASPVSPASAVASDDDDLPSEEPLPPARPRTVQLSQPPPAAHARAHVPTDPMPAPVVHAAFARPPITQPRGVLPVLPAAPAIVRAPIAAIDQVMPIERTAPTGPADVLDSEAFAARRRAAGWLRTHAFAIAVGAAGIVAAIAGGIGVAMLLSRGEPGTSPDRAVLLERATPAPPAAPEALADAELEPAAAPELAPVAAPIRVPDRPAADDASAEPAVVTAVSVAPTELATDDVEPAAAPKQPKKPRPLQQPPATVDFRLDLIDHVSVKIGRRRFEIAQDTRVSAPSGKQRVRWLEPGSSKWRDAGTIDFRTDKRHVLRFGRLSANGFAHREVELTP